MPWMHDGLNSDGSGIRICQVNYRFVMSILAVKICVLVYPSRVLWASGCQVAGDLRHPAVSAPRNRPRQAGRRKHGRMKWQKVERKLQNTGKTNVQASIENRSGRGRKKGSEGGWELRRWRVRNEVRKWTSFMRNTCWTTREMANRQQA